MNDSEQWTPIEKILAPLLKAVYNTELSKKEVCDVVDETVTLLTQLETLARDEGKKELDICVAYCDCGDALERTKLYPGEAEYFCFGCDETYTLVLQQTKEGGK